jgi:hypothetical protein
MTSVVAAELLANNMDISTFITTNNTIKVCGIYNMSGGYVDYDWIAKNYTKIPVNHYNLIIRFSVGYIGTWSPSDDLNLYFSHQYGTSNHQFSYSCSPLSTICSGSGMDCFQNK